MDNQDFKAYMLASILDSLFDLAVFLTPVVLVGGLERSPQWFLVWAILVIKYILRSI